MAALVLAGGIWAAVTPHAQDAVATGTISSPAPSSSAKAAASASGTKGSTPSTSAKASAPASSAKASTPAAAAPATTKAAPLTKTEAAAKAKQDKILATIPQPIAKAVALASAAKPVPGITATVSKIEAVKGVAQGIGEVSGPSVRFTLSLTNGGSTPINTGIVVVNVDSGPNHIPALPLSGPGVVAFPASTAPGQTSSGTYVFLIPNSQRGQVRIFFNYSVSSTIVAFEGALPKAQG